VLFFTGKDFEITSKFENVVTDEITQMRYLNKKLYLSCPARDEIVTLSFNNIPKQAAPTPLKPAVDLVQKFSKNTVKKEKLPSNFV